MNPDFIKKIINRHNDVTDPLVIVQITSTSSLPFYSESFDGIFYDDEAQAVMILENNRNDVPQITYTPINSLDMLRVKNINTTDYPSQLFRKYDDTSKTILNNHYNDLKNNPKNKF